MIEKIVDLGNCFSETGEPRVRLLENSLVKTASSEIQDFWDKLKLSDQYAYLWVIGVSALEYYGCNNNGDAFYEADLKKTLPDWADKAHIFQHHVNKDPRLALGKPVFAWYNDEMHRVELILAIDRNAPGARTVVSRIQNGEQLYVSMGCRVQYDVCSICGHKSRTRAEYCDHLKYNLKKILPDGHQVYALNPDPKFFDISLVSRPADPTAFALDKLASLSDNFENISVPDYNDFIEKAAAFKKVADIIKQVRGEVVSTKIPSVERARDIDDFSDFDYPEIPYDDLDDIGASPADLYAALGELGAPATLGDAFWASRLPAFGVPRPEAFDILPRVLEHLSENPDDADFNIGEAHPVRVKLVIRLIRPAAVKRITIVRSLDGDEEFDKLGRDESNFGSSSSERIWKAISPEGRNFSKMQIMDENGNILETTPYAMRTSTGNVSEGLSTVVGSLLAFGALAGALGSPTLAGKLKSAAVLGIPAYLMLRPSNKQVQIQNTGEIVPLNTVLTSWRSYPGMEKTSKLGIGTVAGFSIPGALALDYLYNQKFQDGRVPDHPVEQKMYHAGRFVYDHPVATTVAGGAIGAGITRGLFR